jgi:dTDP-4-amino-4,6-dideoxygalactose transaminase
MINYGKQSISKTDLRYVERALLSTHLTQGKEVSCFEKEMCEYTGAKYAIAVSSATSALYMLALMLRKDYSIVNVPSITFIADLNPFELLDYDFNLHDIKKDQPIIDDSRSCFTQLTVKVDMCGFPYISKNKHKFQIRDACHSLGGRYYKDKVWHTIGCCKHDDVTVFSFHPVKPITTGEGGMITTNSELIYNTLIKLRSHGFDKDYKLTSPSLNFRMTDIQAALGRSQLRRLNKFISTRREIAYEYYEAFKNTSIQTIKENKNQYSGFHLFPILIENRNEVKEKLYKAGINCQIHYKPIHRMEYYGLKNEDYPNSEYWYNHELSLPIYPALTNKEIKYIIKNVLAIKSS